jgi:trehalose 6-phosphate synthase
VSNNDIQEYCNGLANSVLWPILHYPVDLQDYSRADASGYMRVNHLYADHLSKLINEDDVVWVHDYHLMALARELRLRGHRNRFGFCTRRVRRLISCRPCHTTARSLGD